MNDKHPREYFEQRLEKGLIGPGSDSWGLPDEIEIISDYPLVRYFSGVIFPEKDYSEGKTKSASLDSIINADVRAETDEDEDDRIDSSKNIKDAIDDLDEDDKNEDSNDKKITEVNESENLNSNRFHPNNMGLTLCVSTHAQQLKICVSFGMYTQKDEYEVKIRANQQIFNSFSDENLQTKLSFIDKLAFDGEYMYLTKKLEGFSKGVKRSGDYLNFNEFKKYSNLKDTPTFWSINYLETLIGRAWQRTDMVEELEISVVDNNERIIEISEKITAKLYVKIIQNPKEKDKKYIKLLFSNITKHPHDKFSNKKEELNAKCFFQTKINVSANQLLPYKSFSELHPFDEEVQELNLLYKDVFSYGIGHNCAVEWDALKNSIWTSFMPKYDLKDVKNKFERADEQFTEDVYSKLDSCLDIRSLSIFSNSNQGQVIINLQMFVGLYCDWIENQAFERITCFTSR